MSSAGKQCKAVAWDPRSPSTLMIPSTEPSSKDDAVPGLCLNKLMAHTGFGCNTHETSALMEVLDARDTYLKGEIGTVASIRSVSMAYRKALADCVQGWEEEILSKQESMLEDTDKKDEENLELLKIAFAVTHLSETFLLTPSNDNFMVDYYDNTSSLPGAVTADTIRYLRLHHMSDPSDLVSDEIMQEIANSRQPDQIDGGEPYWQLLESYLLRGCLNDVWALLSRHSLRQRAMETLTLEGLDEYQATSLAQDRDGFRAFEALIMSAPLPAGRTDEFDEDFMTQTDEGEGELLLEGVRPTAYKLWESNVTSRGQGDYPMSYQADAAMGPYRSWQEAVKTLPQAKTLARKIPQLNRVLGILVGNFDGVEFDSWADELGAELLYKNPNVRLQEMNRHASRLMKKHESAKGFDEIILSIMEGNAGSVVQVMHQSGGGTGAALPAVITSLLCDLLDDAQVMPMPSTEYSLKTELLLSAALAIRSSFALEGHRDIGTRLAVRLLLPHITIDADVAITGALVDALEHHYPQTDAEAKTLLTLCRSLVERKNVRVLDGCVSICLARYQHFLADQRPGGAVHWLLEGMELERLVLCGGNKLDGSWQRSLSTGICYRLLVNFCLETSNGLLKGLLGGGEGGVSLLYVRGTEIVAALEVSEIARFISAVKVLEHVVAMAEAVAERKDDAIVGSSIVACLEKRANEEDDGVVSTLAKPNMYWNLIKLAKVILEKNADREQVEELHLYTASFDVRGMQVLLETLTTLKATLDMEGQTDIPDYEIQETRLAFADGLMRAFVAENATKQSISNRVPRVSVEGQLAADLGKVSREKQELVVQRMLEF